MACLLLRCLSVQLKSFNKEYGHSGVGGVAPAVQLLYDPQTFAERLFGMLKSGRDVRCVGPVWERLSDYV